MNDRAVSLFEQYDVTVDITRKARGAIIAQTQLGEVALVEYHGSIAHLPLEYALLKALGTRFPMPLDEMFCNQEGQFYCMDYEGMRYIAKKHVDGRECNVYDSGQRILATEGLAQLHLSMRGLPLSETEPIWRPMPVEHDSKDNVDSENGQMDAEGEDNDSTQLQIVHSFDEVDPYQNEKGADDVRGELSRRTLELVRVRNHIRRSSQKNDFDLAFLKAFDGFLQKAKKAEAILGEDCVAQLGKLQVSERMFAHGDVTQHNILQLKKDVTFVNFEHAGAHLQVKDLYLFMRKVLEKNNWSFEVARDMLDAYQSRLCLSEPELQYLYARFVYPERFWKVANGYVNRRKSIPSKRQLEKLIALEEKEPSRQAFLDKWVETYNRGMLY